MGIADHRMNASRDKIKGYLKVTGVKKTHKYILPFKLTFICCNKNVRFHAAKITPDFLISWIFLLPQEI